MAELTMVPYVQSKGNSIRSQRHGYRSEQRIELMKTFGCTRKVWTPVKTAA